MKPSRYAWFLVALLWVAALLNYLDRQVIFSVFPLLQSGLHLTGLQLGLLGGSFLWVYGILSPAAGFLADRFGRGRTVLVSLLVWSAVTWATGHAQTFNQLFCARALMGISEACFLPAALALVGDYHSENSRSLATGLLMSGNYTGMVIGGVGGGWVGEHFGWRLPFSILGAFGLIYSCVLWLGLKRRTQPEVTAENNPWESMREVLSLPGFGWLTAVFGAVSVANWVAYTWLPLHLYEHIGLSLSDAGFRATFYVQLGSAAGILLGGYMADRTSSRNRRGRLWTQAVGLGVAAPFLFITGSVSSAVFLITSLFMFGIGRGMYDCNCMPILCQIARSPLRATGYGIFNCAGCICGGVMAVVAGWMKSHFGLSLAFQFAAVLWFVSAITLAQLRLQPSPASAEQLQPNSPAAKSSGSIRCAMGRRRSASTGGTPR
jgi:MFS family permease